MKKKPNLNRNRHLYLAGEDRRPEFALIAGHGIRAAAFRDQDTFEELSDFIENELCASDKERDYGCISALWKALEQSSGPVNTETEMVYRTALVYLEMRSIRDLPKERVSALVKYCYDLWDALGGAEHMVIKRSSA